MSKKIIQLANFNVAFLIEQNNLDKDIEQSEINMNQSCSEDIERTLAKEEFLPLVEEPMLKYFDTVMAAFTSGYHKGKESQTLFSDIQIIKRSSEYILIGKIIKSTTLVIKSVLDEDNQLKAANQQYPAAPYSAFAIFLKNHRMAFVKNQKGSPTLREFEGLTRHCINKEVHAENKNRSDLAKEKKEEPSLIPQPSVSIEGIPSAINLKDALAKAEKIKKVNLRFFPLNGDVDFGGVFDSLISEIKEGSGSQSGNLSINSPTKKDGVANMIAGTNGTVAPTIYVRYKDKTEGRITNDDILEEKPIEISGDYVDEHNVAYEGEKIAVLHQCTDEHKRIYKEYESKIIPFVRKR